jgi:hypothetical protein
MAWVTVENSTKTFKSTYSNNPFNNVVKISLEYDSATVTTTSVTVRFKADTEGNYRSDSLLILYKPKDKNSPGTLYKVKPYTSDGSGWPACSTTFTLSKTYIAEKFALGNYWACNNGQDADGVYYEDLTAANVFSRYNDTSKYRGNFSMHVSSADYTIYKSKSVATAGSYPTNLTITDNGNNTFTISGKLGSSGTNNSLKSSCIYYTTDGTDPTDTNKKAIKIDLGADGKVSGKSISSTKTNTIVYCSIKARLYCTFTYNTTNTSIVSGKVRYYVAPKTPGTPTLQPLNRYTKKEYWTYTWPAATGNNTDSPVAGYRMQLVCRKRNAANTGWAGGWGYKQVNLSIDKTTLISGNQYYNTWRDGANNCTIKFRPSDFNLTANDVVKLGVRAYVTRGDGERLWSPGTDVIEGIETYGNTFSAEQVVQNAGVTKVKVDKGTAAAPNVQWTEGLVMVKISDTEWVEAETVYVKTDDGWQESQ